jgi:hypothetical protein
LPGSDLLVSVGEEHDRDIKTWRWKQACLVGLNKFPSKVLSQAPTTLSQEAAIVRGLFLMEANFHCFV